MSTAIVVRDQIEPASLDRLAEAASSYFQTSDWLRAWEATGGTSRSQREVLATGSNGVIEARLGLVQLERRIHRRAPLPLPYWGLTGSGYGAADHLGPVGDDSTFDALIEAALGETGGRAVMFESLDPVHEPRMRRFGFRTVRSTACPRIDLTGVDDERDIWPKKLVKEMRRRERRMEEEGISGRWITDAEEVAAALPSLQAVHLDRWKSQGGAGLFDGDRMELLAALSADRGSRFSPQMYVLEADASIVASLLVLTCGNVVSSYKSGWTPGLQTLAPGVAMHAAAIRRAMVDGRSTYDFLRGTSGHKYTLRAIDRFDVTMIRGSGPVARALEFRETDRSEQAAETASGTDE